MSLNGVAAHHLPDMNRIFLFVWIIYVFISMSMFLMGDAFSAMIYNISIPEALSAHGQSMIFA